MSTTTKLGRVFGIDVNVHVTLWLLLAYVGVREYATSRTFGAALGGVAFVVVLFGTVVLHELGHAAMARRYGIGTKHITLYPTGGVAQLERMPQSPGAELRIALAGPAVNVALAALAFGGLVAFRGQLAHDEGFTTGGSVVARFAALNASIALFNLLPAFPMDGGRVLRAVLALRMPFSAATQAAATVGKAMALLLAAVGIVLNPLLVLVAVFVWVGADAEATEARTRDALAGLSVRAAMVTDMRAVHPDDTLGFVADLLVETPQTDFPVLREGQLVGMLAHDVLIAGLAHEHGGRGARVGAFMKKVSKTLEPSEPLLGALAAFRAPDCAVLAVLEEGHLVGLLGLAHVGELLLVRGALDRHGAEVGSAAGARRG